MNSLQKGLYFSVEPWGFLLSSSQIVWTRSKTIRMQCQRLYTLSVIPLLFLYVRALTVCRGVSSSHRALEVFRAGAATCHAAWARTARDRWFDVLVQRSTCLVSVNQLLELLALRPLLTGPLKFSELVQLRATLPELGLHVTGDLMYLCNEARASCQFINYWSYLLCDPQELRLHCLVMLITSVSVQLLCLQIPAFMWQVALAFWQTREFWRLEHWPSSTFISLNVITIMYLFYGDS